MNRIRNSIVIVSLLMICAAPARSADVPEGTAEPQKAGQVNKIVICTGVESWDLVDEVFEVSSASTSLVYCWTKMDLDAVPSTIQHVWYMDGKKVVGIPLNITTKPFRTWSYVHIRPGQWKVEVTSETGEVLASKEITVH